jgi:hypothetical protein
MTIDELMATQRYQLWNPNSKGDLLIEHPELRKVASFMSLTPRKMLFVWWYACKWSPAMKLVDDKDRIGYSLFRAYGKRVPKDIDETFHKHTWGEEVSQAIADMSGFEPGPRVMMKLMCQDIMDKVKSILSEPAPSNGDWSEAKEYFQALKLGQDLLNGLLPYIEKNAFGITVSDKTEEEEEGEVIEWLHNTRNS